MLRIFLSIFYFYLFYYTANSLAPKNRTTMHFAGVFIAKSMLDSVYNKRDFLKKMKRKSGKF